MIVFEVPTTKNLATARYNKYGLGNEISYWPKINIEINNDKYEDAVSGNSIQRSTFNVGVDAVGRRGCRFEHCVEKRGGSR